MSRVSVPVRGGVNCDQAGPTWTYETVIPGSDSASQVSYAGWDQASKYDEGMMKA